LRLHLNEFSSPTLAYFRADFNHDWCRWNAMVVLIKFSVHKKSIVSTAMQLNEIELLSEMLENTLWLHKTQQWSSVIPTLWHLTGNNNRKQCLDWVVKSCDEHTLQHTLQEKSPINSQGGSIKLSTCNKIVAFDGYLLRNFIAACWLKHLITRYSSMPQHIYVPSPLPHAHLFVCLFSIAGRWLIKQQHGIWLVVVCLIIMAIFTIRLCGE
jgi:hypothetical protein